MTLLQALLIALFVAAIESRALGYATLTMRFSPLMAGFWVGLILGDMHQAMIVTATIQLIYMGVVAPGGAMPSEPAVASAIAVSVACIGDLDPEAAVAIAVPVGLMGSYLYQLRFFLNTITVSRMDACALKADTRNLQLWIGLVPSLIGFALFVPTITIALYLGAPVISDFMNMISDGPVLHALDVVSGGLAALGIAITMHVIGSRKLLVFFFLAYFLVVLTTQAGMSITMITWAVFGCIIAFCYNMFTTKADA